MRVCRPKASSRTLVVAVALGAAAGAASGCHSLAPYSGSALEAGALVDAAGEGLRLDAAADAAPADGAGDGPASDGPRDGARADASGDARSSDGFFVPLDAQPREGGMTRWSYRVAMAVGAGSVSAQLNSFPLLVVVTAARAASWPARPASARDLDFYSAGGTRLPFEVERYEKSTGELVAWVRVDLDPAQPTALWMVFDSGGVLVPPSDPTRVWQAGYVGVWHLGDTLSAGAASTVLDSTSFRHHLTVFGGMSAANRVAGRIAAATSFDGLDDRLSVASTSALQVSGAFTLSAWFRANAWPVAVGTIIAKATTSGSNNLDYLLRAGDSEQVVGMHSGTYVGVSAGNTLALGSWHHLAGVFDGRHLRAYVDGKIAVIAPHSGTARRSPRPLHIGSFGSADAQRTWNGALDEVRVAKVARSPEWIAAVYTNQKAPASFVQVGTALKQ